MDKNWGAAVHDLRTPVEPASSKTRVVDYERERARITIEAGHQLSHYRLIEKIGNRRLLEPIGYLPPVEYEAMYYQQQMALAMAAGVK